MPVERCLYFLLSSDSSGESVDYILINGVSSLFSTTPPINIHIYILRVEVCSCKY